MKKKDDDVNSGLFKYLVIVLIVLCVLGVVWALVSKWLGI
jgi:hypothetical protein